MKYPYIPNVSKEEETEISLWDQSKKQVMSAEWNFPPTQIYKQIQELSVLIVQLKEFTV